MKLSVLLFGAIMCMGSALADDVATPQKLVERKHVPRSKQNWIIYYLL